MAVMHILISRTHFQRLGIKVKGAVFFSVSYPQACTTTSVPLCLVGNKADLRGKVPNSLCVSSACGMRLATVRLHLLFLVTFAWGNTLL